MTQDFDLPVTYKGAERLFSATLDAQRFSHRFLVDVYGQEIAFEPDEERNYRALVEKEMFNKNKKIELELLQAIASAIETIVQ
jgi:hypothetical protein